MIIFKTKNSSGVCNLVRVWLFCLDGPLVYPKILLITFQYFEADVMVVIVWQLNS